MAKKKTTRTTAKKKTAAKGRTAKKTAAKSRTAAAGDKPRTKGQIYGDIATETGLTRKQVASVFDTMSGMIKKDLSKRGPGIFTIPGLCRIKLRHVPKKPARKNVWVPLLQQYRDLPAKPARTTVKVLALKGLKEMV